MVKSYFVLNLFRLKTDGKYFQGRDRIGHGSLVFLLGKILKYKQDKLWTMFVVPWRREPIHATISKFEIECRSLRSVYSQFFFICMKRVSLIKWVSSQTTPWRFDILLFFTEMRAARYLQIMQTANYCSMNGRCRVESQSVHTVFSVHWANTSNIRKVGSHSISPSKIHPTIKYGKV